MASEPLSYEELINPEAFAPVTYRPSTQVNRVEQGSDNIFAAAARGAARGLDEIGDIVLPDDWFEVSDYRSGGFSGIVEGISQFAVGFLIPGGIVGKGVSTVAKGAKAGSFLSKAANFANKNMVVNGMLKGAAADMAAFDPHEHRLSNVLEQFDNPLANNAITQFLAADPNDSAAAGRLKNALEGLALGSVTDTLLAGLRSFKAHKTAKAKLTGEATPEQLKLKTDLEEQRAQTQAAVDDFNGGTIDCDPTE